VIAVPVIPMAVRRLRVQALPEKQHQRRSNERKQGNEPDAIEEEHSRLDSFQTLRDGYHRKISISSA